MRRRFVWNDALRKLVEVPISRPVFAPLIMKDLPDYVSPVSGKVISGRRARRDDLARTNSRPYEGREQEAKELARRNAYVEERLDRKAEAAAHDAWAHSPEYIRRALRGN